VIFVGQTIWVTRSRVPTSTTEDLLLARLSHGQGAGIEWRHFEDAHRPFQNTVLGPRFRPVGLRSPGDVEAHLVGRDFPDLHGLGRAAS